MVGCLAVIQVSASKVAWVLQSAPHGARQGDGHKMIRMM
uniref:Uncharacterized protein n=1 Tax=Arundo donax TaxID=35708 RepID=A0A0A9AY37_ARUDO